MMMERVIVAVRRTGRFPVRTGPVMPTEKVPEVAVSLPASRIWSAVWEEVKVTLIPKYGACPVFVIVVVIFTCVPGVAVAGLGTVAIASWDTVTVLAHRGSVLPDGQLLPAAADVTTLDKTWFPVSGLSTVTE